MRLVWHIAKKDLRRLAPAVGVWLGLLVTVAIVMSLVALPEEEARARNVHDWMINLKIAAGCLAGTAAALGTLLVAQLVQEDPVTREAAMWRTRPIGAGRLLGAKLLVALLVFVALPVAALTPVWLGNGFSAEAWGTTAVATIATQLVIVAVAGGLAAITKDLGAFVFAVAGVAALVFVGWLPIEEVLGGAPGGVQQTRIVLTWPLALVAVVAAGAMQYLTQRTRWAWMTLGLGMAVMVAVRIAWPWDSLPERPGIFGRWGEVAQERGAAVAVEKIVAPADQSGALPATVVVHPEAGANQFSAPWNGRAYLSWSARQGAEGSLETSGKWGEDAVQRVLGLVPNTGPVKWELAWRARAVQAVAEWGMTARADARLRMARMQARVVVELPWRAGAMARADGSATRIVSVGQLPGSMQHGVMIEERDPARGLGAQRRDCFALVNRRLGIFLLLPAVEQGAAEGAGLRVSEHLLTYEPPRHEVAGRRVEVPDWERDAVLVKVRFEVIERWQAPVVTERVEIVAEEKKL